MLSPGNVSEIHGKIKPCVENAYGRKELEKEMLDAAYFALTIEKEIPCRDPVVAALVGYWLPFPDNAIETRFESVRKSMQRRGLGSLLFDTLHATVAYLGKCDPFICLNLGSTREVSVQVHVDLEECVDWHTSMLIKRCYKQISCVHDELVLEKIVSF